MRFQPRLPRSVSVCPSLGAIVFADKKEGGLSVGLTSFAPVTLTLRVICPAPQDMVPEMANEYGDDIGDGYIRALQTKGC